MGASTPSPLREEATTHAAEGPAPHRTTLLELVRAIGEVTADDREVVATVRSLLRSGRVRLCGNFRNASPEDFS